MRSLFGGAITAEIPATLIDASELREVPDNQEVLVGSLKDYDVSVIVELLEPVDKPDLMDALAYHVDETHRVSDTADEDREQPLELMTAVLNGYELGERIDVIKTKDDKTISLVFGLFRLKEYKTEVFITCTLTPQQKRPGSGEIHAQRQILRELVESFKVVDPGLFNKD